MLDTSVLLADPGALRRFAEHEVVLPVVVITELEAKRHHPELGYFARSALRMLDDLRVLHGRLDEPVPVGDDGGTIRVELNHTDAASLPSGFRLGDNDTRILAVARNLADEGHDVTLVSKDLPLRIKASAVGLDAEEYRAERSATPTPVRPGWPSSTSAPPSSTSCTTTARSTCRRPATCPATPGWCCSPTAAPPSAGSAPTSRSGWSAATARRSASTAGRPSSGSPWRCCSIPRSASSRSAGAPAPASPRWRCAPASRPCWSAASTRRSIVFRPLFAVGGQELGYLPGSESEKMSPWAQAVFDTLGAITSREVIDEVLDRGMLEVLPLTHIRGRSLHDAFVIVDEAQSLERNVLLTVLSRIGAGSKVVLTHDVAQRDNLRVGRHDGVVAVVEKLKGHPLFAHVTLTRSERSPIAALVTEMLENVTL